MSDKSSDTPLFEVDLSYEEAAYCFYGLKSKTLDGMIVSRELQIVPSHSYRFGDGFSTAAGARTRSFGLWAFSTAGRSISQLAEDHAQVLLDLLEPKLEQLTELRSRFTTEARVRIVVESDANVGGADLKSETLARLARICDELTFSAQLTRSTDFEPVPGLQRPS